MTDKYLCGIEESEHTTRRLIRPFFLNDHSNSYYGVGYDVFHYETLVFFFGVRLATLVFFAAGLFFVVFGEPFFIARGILFPFLDHQ
jgi:hypothetical protein